MEVFTFVVERSPAEIVLRSTLGLRIVGWFGVLLGTAAAIAGVISSASAGDDRVGSAVMAVWGLASVALGGRAARARVALAAEGIVVRGWRERRVAWGELRAIDLTSVDRIRRTLGTFGRVHSALVIGRGTRVRLPVCAGYTSYGMAPARWDELVRILGSASERFGGTRPEVRRVPWRGSGILD